MHKIERRWKRRCFAYIDYQEIFMLMRFVFGCIMINALMD